MQLCTSTEKTKYGNGVQEAASSNLVTRTNAEYRFSILCIFFVLLPQRTSGLLGAKRRSIRRRLAERSRQATGSNLVTRTNAEYRFSILCVFSFFCRKELAGSWARSAVLSAAALSAPSVLPLYARPDRRCCRQSMRYGIQLLQQI